MLTKQKTADEFWAWFRQHSKLFARLPLKGDKAVDHWMGELHTRLYAYSRHYLYIDLDWLTEDGTSRLIVSAGGRVNHFPKVEALVSRAPVMPGWGTSNEMCLTTLFFTVPGR